MQSPHQIGSAAVASIEVGLVVSAVGTMEEELQLDQNSSKVQTIEAAVITGLFVASVTFPGIRIFSVVVFFIQILKKRLIKAMQIMTNEYLVETSTRSDREAPDEVEPEPEMRSLHRTESCAQVWVRDKVLEWKNDLHDDFTNEECDSTCYFVVLRDGERDLYGEWDVGEWYLRRRKENGEELDYRLEEE
ncbi:hypothetical protein PRIPAC_90071 [Pristionchus pacificus]|uniref:Uncharacterized protein n=1 Tax=Pristionchus pacificus TaxID=54126 RepID=A0A2A6B7Q0_PRIPA|nr:hypothetical protein PRIPAC_90071 [Pristionchus pacificus]|eukprot:PDM61883.1 hypothetical protein PRIPAC_51325 [Pristionchus pacificus]